MNSQYIPATVKHPSSVVFWGCLTSQGQGDLYFLPKGQMINATCYIDALDTYLQAFMNIHGCMTFQQDSALAIKPKWSPSGFKLKHAAMARKFS